MTRWIAIIGATLIFTVVALGNAAEAARYSRKKCIPPADRAQSSWVCSASEICCYDYVLRQGTCPRDRCF